MHKLVTFLTEDTAGAFLAGWLMLLVVLGTVVLADFLVGTFGPFW